MRTCATMRASPHPILGEGGPRPAYYFLKINVDQFVEHIITINATGR